MLTRTRYGRKRRAAEIAFDSDGYLQLSWNGNGPFKRGYVNVGLDAVPAYPTASSKDATLTGRSGTIRMDGTGGAAVKRASVGQYVYVRAVAENTLGIISQDHVIERKRRRGDTEFVPPRFRIRASRSGTTVTVTITGTDPSKALSAFDYSYSYPDGSGGTSSETNGTSWTSGSWTLGATTISVTKVLTVPAGVTGQFSFRATFYDELGTSREKGAAIALENIDEVIKTVIVDHLTVVPALSAVGFYRDARYAYLDVVTTAFFRATVLPLPIGVTITQFRARMYASGVGVAASARLRRVNSSDTPSDVSSALSWSNEGVSWKSDAVSATVGAEESYQVEGYLTPVSTADTARFYRAEVEYSVPSYDKTV